MIFSQVHLDAIIGLMWPDPDDTHELVGRLRAGDPDAADRLLERHREALRRMVQMRLDLKIQPRVDASDIVQEVLLQASRRLKDYLANPAMPFHLWLRHIARDRLIDAHRRHRVSGKRTVDREQAMVTRSTSDRSATDLLVQLCDDQLTPATAAALNEVQQQVEAAIERLGEVDREIVLMRHFEHLNNREAAQALGLSEPAASMRYLRAIRRLRQLLAGPE